MSATADTVLHTYGVVENARVPVPPSGIGRAPVTAVDLGKVAVVVSRLDARDYGPEAWERHGQDPAWLEPIAREHHAVLQALCDEGDRVGAVAPLRLPGIYPDEAAVRTALEGRVEDLRRVLDDVRGHVEWGVKLFLVTSTQQVPAERPSSGREYLRRKSAAAEDRERVRRQRQQLVHEAYESLVKSATRSVSTPPLDGALSGRKEPMLLNSAHLVADAARAPFFEVVEQVSHRVATEGMTVEVSGPWPPYSFATLDSRPETS